jgi:hypothetical protein
MRSCAEDKSAKTVHYRLLFRNFIFLLQAVQTPTTETQQVIQIAQAVVCRECSNLEVSKLSYLAEQ